MKFTLQIYKQKHYFRQEKMSACLFINEAERERENFTTKPEIIVATDFFCILFVGSTITRNKAKLR